MLNFQLVPRGKETPEKGINTVYLQIDWWDDHRFVTMFHLSVHDNMGQKHDIGSVKIGFKGQRPKSSTYETLTNTFQTLPDQYFSLGQEIDYYKHLSLLPNDTKEHILKSLNDVVFNNSYTENLKEEVFRTSLLRDISLSVIKGQFSRVLVGQPPLTDFNFSFIIQEQKNIQGMEIKFDVLLNSTPSTNIHAIIGRNGTGKTTLLNDMIKAITSPSVSRGNFYEKIWSETVPISKDFFSRLVSVSFSAFDPFTPPFEQTDPSNGTCYFYIGLKDRRKTGEHRTLSELKEDCAIALIDCFKSKEKTTRWHTAIHKLSSDENFYFMGLHGFEYIFQNVEDHFRKTRQQNSEEFHKLYLANIQPYLDNMSSGHAIVLLTITRLVATVEEKTLILLDEPESHLHPPLLSAFIRALNDLLHDRNGVAIIATHSPVILQEVPKSCVWNITRVGSSINYRRPEEETFGENVGVLTKAIFGLETIKSGFYDMLTVSVEKGGTYTEILEEYQGQIGIEGRAILKALVLNRDDEVNNA
ncbi:MAG: hypothetical protein A3J37_07310 [Alphaproteobacteria bacterium RIFCSPHIGHO2_12_FULL_45_9]|nr:MAG: hypothetical protein A3B66_04725 [Alphaproteobacteria bacterium RIFCSPHIGHO2_02_FULL_46_13]OFW96867.1 MAG: hypothetical protein A3J37_07310 [Alphaproteobacteria bacterium RIFCSPHIGHO2_12_FULL_45_9]